MYKKLLALFIALLFLNYSFAQQDVPETTVQPGALGKSDLAQQQVQQQQQQMVEVQAQLIEIKEILDSKASQQDVIVAAQEIARIVKEVSNNIVLLIGLMLVASLIGFYGAYFLLKARKRI